MSPRFPAAIATLGVLSALPARAYEIRSQWSFLIGEGDAFEPVPTGVFDATALPPGAAIRLRLSFGVFDDGAGPAPAGGYLGWINGTLSSTGGSNTRTGGLNPPGTTGRGRIRPFNFAPSPPGEGLPATDPWVTLTGIDNTLGTQPFEWLGIDGTGDPGPPPPPIIYARNTLAPTYEITTVIADSGYSITAAGNVLGALGWNSTQQHGPDPGPDGIFGPPGSPEDADDIPSSVLYAPLADSLRLFSNTLTIIVPAPAATTLLILGAALASFRRR